MNNDTMNSKQETEGIDHSDFCILSSTF